MALLGTRYKFLFTSIQISAIFLLHLQLGRNKMNVKETQNINVPSSRPKKINNDT
jgi:hypothetical protein